MKPNQRATVYTLLERKTSQREIARLTGIDRKTVRSYHKRWLAEQSNSPGVATDPADQITPPWPPASTLGKAPGGVSLCAPIAPSSKRSFAWVATPRPPGSGLRVLRPAALAL